LFEKIGHLRVMTASTTTTTPTTIDTIAVEVRELSSITATLVEQVKNTQQTSGLTSHLTAKLHTNTPSNATHETPTWATSTAHNARGSVYNIRPIKEKPVAKKHCELCRRKSFFYLSEVSVFRLNKKPRRLERPLP
jgi:hypothetical protein